MGWLLAGTPMPAQVRGRAGTAGAVAAVFGTCIEVAGPAAGIGFVVGLAAGFAAGKAFECIPTLKGQP
jgi:hypothetical protein